MTLYFKINALALTVAFVSELQLNSTHLKLGYHFYFKSLCSSHMVKKQHNTDKDNDYYRDKDFPTTQQSRTMHYKMFRSMHYSK